MTQPTVDDINEDVLKRGQEVGLKSAFEVVSMAVATGLQNELAMHSSFETTSNTVLNLALTKMAEAAANKDAEGIKNWEQVIESVTKGKIEELKSFTAFNKAAEDLLTQFPKAG
jgi:hypothetical protein